VGSLGSRKFVDKNGTNRQGNGFTRDEREHATRMGDLSTNRTIKIMLMTWFHQDVENSY
jgi:hypothetical protein